MYVPEVATAARQLEVVRCHRQLRYVLLLRLAHTQLQLSTRVAAVLVCQLTGHGRARGGTRRGTRR